MYTDFCKPCRRQDRKLMLLVSLVLFLGIALVAYLFVDTAQAYFGFEVSAGMHLVIAGLAGFVTALSSVGIYRNRCKRCSEQPGIHQGMT